MISKLTPILIVDSIEDCLGLWTEQLGFKVAVQVPHEDKIGFAILQNGKAEAMLQTRQSLEADLPQALKTQQPTLLYAETKDLDAIVKDLGTARVLVPKRKTFYGADEVWIQTDTGHVIGLSAHA